MSNLHYAVFVYFVDYVETVGQFNKNNAASSIMETMSLSGELDTYDVTKLDIVTILDDYIHELVAFDGLEIVDWPGSIRNYGPTPQFNVVCEDIIDERFHPILDSKDHTVCNLCLGSSGDLNNLYYVDSAKSFHVCKTCREISLRLLCFSPRERKLYLENTFSYTENYKIIVEFLFQIQLAE